MNIEILEGRITFRDAFRDMLESVPTPFEECKEVLKKSAYSFFPAPNRRCGQVEN